MTTWCAQTVQVTRRGGCTSARSRPMSSAMSTWIYRSGMHILAEYVPGNVFGCLHTESWHTESYSQGREIRPAGAEPDQVRAGNQPQDCQGPHHRRAADGASARRRGDRVTDRAIILDCCDAQSTSASGQNRRYRIPTWESALTSNSGR